ncbi:hypothetical protein D8M06_01700 [Oceanobacillus halophilus]|uniref:Uncharacterized protein n=1 Tax=Oceanobacillus halophilus TaxID=930130 RepID=A0A495AC23_9BACI|nr:hypothetical protein D8M06_01700 [Oceanobacillus halophilus]
MCYLAEIYVDSCGMIGLDETPQCVSTKEAHQPPAESEVYFQSGIYAPIMFRFSFEEILLSQPLFHLKRLLSKVLYICFEIDRNCDIVGIPIICALPYFIGVSIFRSLQKNITLSAGTALD